MSKPHIACILFGLGAVLATVVGCGHRGEDLAPAGGGTKVEVTENGVRPEVKATDGKAGEGDRGLPDNWTHQDLAAFLAKKGVKVDVKSLPILSRSDQLVSQFRDSDAFREADLAGKVIVPANIYVYRCKDDRTAKELLGSMGTGSFTRGRFVFEARTASPVDGKNPSDVLLNRIKTVLD